jgi:thiamine-phosphate pyrophosphorylase
MRLYALCDQDSLNKHSVSIESFVDIATKNNAEIIQYRNKNASSQDVKKVLITLRTLWSGFLIANDHIELCSFCDGIHLGQEDLKKIDSNEQKAIKIVREVIGSEKIIGLSTHNKQEVEIANSLELNYVGLGAFRTTSTKNVDNILGEKLDKIAGFSKHPVAAIGGVTFNDSFKNVTYHVIGSALLS